MGSLDMSCYGDFDVIKFIKDRLPKMLAAIRKNYAAYQAASIDEVDENELFELTLYTHQVHKLRQKDKLNANDTEILKESIAILRNIQVEFVDNEQSLKRFDIMFRSRNRTKYAKADSVSKESLTLEAQDAAKLKVAGDGSPITDLDLKDEESQTLIAAT